MFLKTTGPFEIVPGALESGSKRLAYSDNPRGFDGVDILLRRIKIVIELSLHSQPHA